MQVRSPLFVLEHCCLLRRFSAIARGHPESSVQRKINKKESYKRKKDFREEYDRVCWLENKDRKSEYENRHKDHKRHYDREYYLRNSSDKKESSHRYYLNNKDIRREYNREYYLRNQTSVRSSMRNRYVSAREPESYLPREIADKSWKTPESARDYFVAIAPQLCISNYIDWYRVSRAQIGTLGGWSLISKFENLGHALQYAYPEFNWDPSKFSISKKKSKQKFLRRLIEQLLPNEAVIEDYQHSDLTCENSIRFELDVWIPKHRVGIEYQGEHHYNHLDGAYGPNGAPVLYSERDLSKYSACRAQGIKLILIPYWWDGGIDSLSATLYQACPGVFPSSTASPIPAASPASSHSPFLNPSPSMRYAE